MDSEKLLVTYDRLFDGRHEISFVSGQLKDFVKATFIEIHKKKARRGGIYVEQQRRIRTFSKGILESSNSNNTYFTFLLPLGCRIAR
jgi:hypothetical protein